MARTPLLPIVIAFGVGPLVALAPAQSFPAVEKPTSLAQPGLLPVTMVSEFRIPSVDHARIRLEDDEREALGLPPRFAIPHPVFLTPATHGTWEPLDDASNVWRLRIHCEEAASINLGFGRYHLPVGAKLILHSEDYAQTLRPFTHLDNESHGELWTPVVRTNALVVELTVPEDGLHLVSLDLTHIGYGYRGFQTKHDHGSFESGSCNVDVVCPVGGPWQNEIQAVAGISTGGSLFCTGFMVNNTANDKTPYFMTANHCGISAGNAASLVVYWNFETSVCDGTPDGQLTDFQTGSFFRSAYSPSDFTLVELDDTPDPAWDVTFSGWDRSGVDPGGAIAIHHPSGDEKRISFEDEPTSTTSYLGAAVPGDGTHVRVEDWDIGTTEPGSSGSPLFDPNHRVIGQLHGGYAACGNDLDDWYGRVSVSWNGGGTSSSRLSDWLDPTASGAMFVDTLGTSLSVSPAGSVVHSGPVGGPFTNATVNYTLTNQTPAPLNYQVSLGSSLGLLLDGGTSPVSGTLAASGGTAQVQVTLSAAINALTPGLYPDTISFEDQTNSVTTVVNHTVEVGKILAFSFPLDTDPGWTEQGQWDFGVPTGGGGEHGLVDPTAGATGSNVMGYNLAGDYANNMSETHLTTTALNCSGLVGVEVRFQRWLNVEQPLYDHAYLRVSNDGTNFVTIWENGSEITDSSWSEQSFDISAVADGQSTVYLRWTMGSTDGSWLYSGWNVDDVQVLGIAQGYFVEYGSSCPAPGFDPHLTGSGLPSPGGEITMTTTGGPAGGLGALYLSASQNLSGCLLLNAPLAGPFVVPFDGTGTVSLGGTIPSTFPGSVHVYMQMLAVGGGDLAYSNGLDMYVE